jgi:DNA-binding cell septation regulator SpoVG
LLPAVIVVAVVLYVAMKDRRTPDEEQHATNHDTADERRD